MDGSKTKSIVMVALYLCLIIVSSYIKIPIMAVPITLQLVCVFILSCISQKFTTTKALLIYLLGGLAGLPFFTQGGGLSYFIKPHFGYLLGFLGMSVLIEVFRYVYRKKGEPSRWLLLALGYLFFYTIALSYVYVLHRYFFMQPILLGNLMKLYWLAFIVSDGTTLFIGQKIVAMFWAREKNMNQKKSEIAYERT